MEIPELCWVMLSLLERQLTIKTHLGARDMANGSIMRLQALKQFSSYKAILNRWTLSLSWTEK